MLKITLPHNVIIFVRGGFFSNRYLHRYLCVHEEVVGFHGCAVLFSTYLKSSSSFKYDTVRGAGNTLKLGGEGKCHPGSKVTPNEN